MSIHNQAADEVEALYEAHYWFTLQQFADMVNAHGSEQVLHDLQKYLTNKKESLE